MKTNICLPVSSSYANILGGNKFSYTGDSPKWVKHSNATSGGAHKAAWAKITLNNMSKIVFWKCLYIDPECNTKLGKGCLSKNVNGKEYLAPLPKPTYETILTSFCL